MPSCDVHVHVQFTFNTLIVFDMVIYIIQYVVIEILLKSTPTSYI